MDWVGDSNSFADSGKVVQNVLKSTKFGMYMLRIIHLLPIA